jgi:cytochrome c oxidase assembly protein subunit 15
MANSTDLRPNRTVALWLLTGVFMLCVQVILGGITRLTGSGLSITEWNVITGTVPPLSHLQWITEFEKYRQTPQWRLLHTDFTLSDFKFIFFWEWFHRFWARLVGVVFLVGLVYFIWKKLLRPTMVKPLLILFLLGALQGAVGWIMVASGLVGDATYVQPTKLALHFIFALGLIGYTFWFALQLLVPREQVVHDRLLNTWTWVIIAILFFQLIFGALMAGHKAATAAPTWPTINGDWIPASSLDDASTLRGLLDNKIAIQFVHRSLAYLLLAVTIYWTWLSLRAGRDNRQAAFSKYTWLPLSLLCVQVVLGISTLLSSQGIIPDRWVLFDWLAQFHQITALVFLLAMIYMLFAVRPAGSAA